MHRVFLAFLILICGTSLALADGTAFAAVPPQVHTLLGAVVKSVSLADPVQGTSSQIVVTDAARKKVIIIVTPTTTLWDADAKAIMQDMIVPKKKVNVIYVTNVEGVNVAKSIKVLK